MKIDGVFGVSPVAFPQIRSQIFGEDTSERVVVTGSYISTGDMPSSVYRLAPVSVSQSVHVIYLISPAK